MPSFTTRPEIRGTFGAVASTHWLASAVGMGILEKGGTRLTPRRPPVLPCRSSSRI